MLHAKIAKMSSVKTQRDPQELQGKRYRPEIEGLRTVAFLLVAVFHIWLNRVSGGVDVFFTVAGFLVTLSLLSQIRKFGTVRAGQFFGRLALRLLPPALLVLGAVAVLTLILLPFSEWRNVFGQVFASSAYWENWYLGINAVDYLAVDTSRSPVQHFWAMSVQGQFYVLWFLAFILAIFIAGRIRKRAKSVAAVLVAALVVISFIWSVYQTRDDQQFAYFSTLTRIWEFGVGSLIAMVIERVKINQVLAAVLSWASVAMIICVGVLLPVADLFPGWVAVLPVAAACIIILTGQDQARWGASALLASKPLVWLGGLGYGVYLWHWPILIFVLHVQGRNRAGLLTGIAVIALALLLSWLTKRLVENPFMKARQSTSPRAGRIALLVALSGVVIVAGASSLGVVKVDERVAAEQKMAGDPCLGANALAAEPECAEANFGGRYLPSTPDSDAGELFTGSDPSGVRCATGLSDPELRPCRWGDPTAEVRVALIGNSHGAVWFPAFKEIAANRGWLIDAYFKHSCTYNSATRSQQNESWRTSCDEWNESLTEYLAAQEPYDYVLTSAIAQNSSFTDLNSGETGISVGAKGYEEVWRPLIDRGATILAMRDYPRAPREVIDCARQDPTSDCSFELAEVQVPLEEEVLMVAANRLEGAVPIDMQGWFCVDGVCPGVIGNTHVYRDAGHFTGTYGRTLAGPLEQALMQDAGLEYAD